MNFLISFLAAALVNITPAPVSVESHEGEFVLPSKLVISSPDAPEVARFFATKISKSTGNKVKAGRSGQIELSIDPQCGLPAEGYTLEVQPDGVKAVAPDAAGLFYAMDSFLQLLPPQVESPRKVSGVHWAAPCVSIKDYPRFGWRGFMVDPCRHFTSVKSIKKQIDMLAAYKINVMHWHLTDDQGWRIQIKKYPRLTSKGAWRTEADGSRHGGYYTQRQVRKIVKYAADRHITIIPEIEVPGHAVSAVLSYPELSCEGAEVEPNYTWGVRDVVYCPGNERLFEFLEDVFAELVPLFPSEWYHIGGDECLKNKWRECPKCQARIQELGLVADSLHTAEEKLQSYTVQRVEKILNSMGKKVIGWDEILEGGLGGNAAVMSWRGEQGGIAAARQHHYVVMSSSRDGLYFDSYQGDSKVEPLNFGRYAPLEMVYRYDPVPAVLQEEGLGGYVLGVQGNIWSEYIYDDEQKENRMYPRCIALAEIAWSQTGNKDWDSFRERVDGDAAVRMDCHDINYHIPLPEQPGGSCSHLAFADTAVVEFTTTRPEKMVYTLDGTEPSADSPEYLTPFVFTEDAIINIRTVLPAGQMSAVRTIEVQKQQASPATELQNPVPGLAFRKTYGKYLSAAELPDNLEWEESRIVNLAEISRQEPATNNMQDVPLYAAEAEGFAYLDKSGTYTFSTLCDQLWIDGRLVVDNGTESKRFTRQDSQMVLQAGYHSIRLVFLGNIIGGWHSANNATVVNVKYPGEREFQRLQPEQLFTR